MSTTQQVVHSSAKGGVARLVAATKKPESRGRQTRTFVLIEGVLQRTGRIAHLKEHVSLKQKEERS